MRKLLATLALASAINMNAAQKIDRIEPSNWFVGMKNPTVQLMVYGEGIRTADVETDYPGVRIDSLVRLDSPNYLLIYMDVGKARPGTMRLRFRSDRGKATADFQLRQREMSGDKRQGFTCADVLYMLMPDRFASAPGPITGLKGLLPFSYDRSEPSRRHGGNIEGIRRHLDYFTQLGVTALWFTPVLDPYASKVDLHETVDGWFVKSMPDLNQRNPHLMTYLIQNSEWWIETVGIDGIRMDTYPYADREGMARWMKALNDEYPNFNTVGETWVTEPAYTAAWQKDSPLSEVNSNLKTVMDFSFFDRINQAKSEETDDWWKGMNRIYNSLCYDYLYKDPSHVMAFIENHDTDRFLGDGTDTLALRQALALLLTIKRIPQLYYGTEVLMNGTKSVTDGNVRRDFPGGFPGDTHNAFTAEGRTKAENDMFRWLSRLLHWRKGNDIIAKGTQTQFIPYKGIYVVARSYGGRHVLTVLNGTSKAASMHVGRYAEIIGQATHGTNILTGRAIDLTKDVRLTPRGVMVIEL